MRPGEGGNVGVGSWIERWARVAPERPALVTDAGALTYAELASRVRRLANGLRALGVLPGERVAWLGPNHPAFLETLFAAGVLGAVLAPVNHRLGPEERAEILLDTEPSVVIEHHSLEPTDVPASVRHRIAVGRAGDRGRDFEMLIAASPDAPLDATVGLDDLFMLPHTSGTTGRPKGVMLSHGNVTWNAVNLTLAAGLRPDDVTIAIAPFFRVGGTGVNVLPVVFAGGTVVLPADAAPDRILALVERHRVTVGFGNPDLLDALVHSPRWPTADLSSIRLVITGGAPVPDRLLRTYDERHVPLLQGYGLSETAPAALLLDPETAAVKSGSAGRPLLLVDTRIVDADDRDLPPGETGELLVRGPTVMAGYWRRPEDTARVLISDGWLRTGDAARADEDGFVWIVDRVESRFRTAAGVVYPGDVERVLATHLAVADVGVVGIPASGGVDVGIAFVVRAADPADEAQLLAFARERLPPQAVPIAIRFVASVPRNSVGKLLRQELRALAIGEVVGPAD